MTKYQATDETMLRRAECIGEAIEKTQADEKDDNLVENEFGKVIDLTKFTATDKRPLSNLKQMHDAIGETQQRVVMAQEQIAAELEAAIKIIPNGGDCYS